jgi:predicted O-methyltransferase YrrM
LSLPIDAFTGILHPEVKAYLEALPEKPDALLQALSDYAAERGFPLVGRSSGRTMALLLQLIGGKRVYEFGSGFGYSAYFFARAVGANGEVHGAEKDAWELEAHARLYAGSPLIQRIHLHEGEAFAVLEGLEGDFDAFFLDLDKVDYPRALAVAKTRLRPGGLIFADNVLWGGKTSREVPEEDEGTRALQVFNRLVHEDPELQTVILAVGDGLSVSLKAC